MSMRVTPQRQFELSLLNSQAHYAQGARLQQQISSGLQINKPSDDPTGQKVVLKQTALLQQFDTQLSTVDSTRSILTDAQTQIQDAQQLLVQAKDIALQARQSTEPTDQKIYVQQLDSILKQLEDISNSQSNGQYLFAGTQSGVKPFAGVADGAAIYQGGTASAKATLPGHADIKTYYSGADVFLPGTSGALAISGTTGIATGAGTSSGSATTTLVIKHTQTSYAGSSGVTAGTSSAAGDTILGPAGTHTLVINDTSGTGAAGTVSLNGGPEIQFTSADGNLEVTGPNGEKVYINTQSISAGFQGTVQISTQGTLSIDGGATEVPIDYSNDQILTNNQPAVVQHFDTTELKSAGTVTVAPAQTANVFQVISSLKETIQNSRGLSLADQDAAYERSLQNLDSASDHLLNVIGEQSVDLEHLDTVESRINTLKLNAQTLLSNTQSTDYTSAITNLQQQQNLLQFTLQTISVMNKISIVDYL